MGADNEMDQDLPIDEAQGDEVAGGARAVVRERVVEDADLLRARERAAGAEAI